MIDFHSIFFSKKSLYRKLPFIENNINNTDSSLVIIKKNVNKLNQIHGVNYNIKFWSTLLLPHTQQLLEIINDRYQLLKSISQSSKIQIDYDKKFITDYFIKNRHYFSMLSNFANHDIMNYYLCSDIIANTSLKSKFLINNNSKKAILKPDTSEKNISKNYSSIKLNIINTIKLVSTFFAKKFNKNIFFIDFSVPSKDLIKISLRLRQFPSFATYKNTISSKKSNYRDFIEDNVDFEETKESDTYNYCMQNYIRFLPQGFLEDFSFQNRKYKRISKKKYICCSRPTSSNISVRFTLAHLISKGSRLITFQHGGGYRTKDHKSLELIESKMSSFYHSWAKDFIIRDDLFYSVNKNKHKNNFDILIIGPSFYKYQIYNFGGHHPFYNSIIEKRIMKLISILNDEGLKIYYRSYKGMNDNISIKMKFTQNNKKSVKQLIEESQLIVCCNPFTQTVESLISNKPFFLFWGNEHLFNSNTKNKLNSEIVNKVLFNNPIELAKQISLFKKDPSAWHEKFYNQKNIIQNLFGNYDDDWLLKTVNKIKNIINNGENE